jgi:hypothetical protein
VGFDKTVPSQITEYEVYEAESTDELRKVASEKVDLPDGFQYDPDYFYMWIRIISSGEFYGPNKNGDYFSTEELLKSYETFNDAHVFKNHENKKIEKAIGRIFSVRWNPIMKCVEIFKGVDRKLAPEIVRGFMKGFLTDVSMGCKVPYTVCSICGNKARRQSEFCNHVKNYRMQYLGNGERVFEINYEPKFHDSSVVLNGAERVAKALMIFDQPEDGTLVQSFQKAASANGVMHFVRLTDHELEKVASFNEKAIHPLLRPYEQEKIASMNPMMMKLAELEKDVTGKILNIVSSPFETKPKAAEQLIQIVKFLTEKRLDEEVLKSIAHSLDQLSKTEGVSVSKAFSTFIGVAELMGIELFPTELHTILCELTSARFEKSMTLSDSDKDEAYPSDFAKGIKTTLQATEQLPHFDDPSDLFHAYDEFPRHEEAFRGNPSSFFGSAQTESHLGEEAPIHMVRVIRRTLEPFMDMRSHHSEHLLPRLSVILGGHRPLIGNHDVARDLQVMSAPQTLGDMLAGIAYTNYQQMRPQVMVARLTKTAKFFDSDLEKLASDKPYKGIKRRHLLMTAVPAMYGASMFEKNRRENGRNLSDVENFIADRPDVLAGGMVLAGKPLSAAIGKGVIGARKATGKGIKNVADKAKELNGKAKEGFKKMTSEEVTSFVKLADSMDSGAFSAFDDVMLLKFATANGINNKTVGALKVASLLTIGGMDKEASAVLSKYELNENAVGLFLQEAGAYTSEHLEKAAEDFSNTLVLDGLIDQRSFATTAHGRLLDAFVFKKIGDLTKKKTPGVETPKVKGVESHVSQ